MSTTRLPQQTRFGHLSIAYDERVLRPRRWTVRQSRWAAEMLPTAPPGPVLELCAGAGQIGLLAVASSQRRLVAVDLDPVACEFAQINARTAGMEGRVEVRQGDLREDALRPDERFALILADPPYLPSSQTDRYPEDPLLAIDGGADGLDLVWPCVDAVAHHLLPGARALLQLRSVAQVHQVRDRLDADGDLRVLEYRSHGRGALTLLGRS